MALAEHSGAARERVPSLLASCAPLLALRRICGRSRRRVGVVVA
jgi:hypothetical protein